jgi:hypothetical protein
VMLLITIPWAGAVWALPFLTVLAPSERYHQERGHRHKKLTDAALYKPAPPQISSQRGCPRLNRRVSKSGRTIYFNSVLVDIMDITELQVISRYGLAPGSPSPRLAFHFPGKLLLATPATV